MKTLNAFVLIPCLALLVSMPSCTTIPGPNTASGGPEITVRGMTEAEVREEISASYVDAGFKVARDEGHSLAFVKNIPSPSAWMKGRVKYIQVEFSIDREPSAGDCVLDGFALYDKQALELNTPEALMRVSTPRERDAAEAHLWRSIRKSLALDGLLSYYAMRPLARILTKGLLNTKITPNQTTLGALACGLGAALLGPAGPQWNRWRSPQGNRPEYSGPFPKPKFGCIRNNRNNTLRPSQDTP